MDANESTGKGESEKSTQMASIFKVIRLERQGVEGGA